MFLGIIDKIFDTAVNDTHDKLTDFLLKLANTLLQLSVGILIIVYCFQSFILWSAKPEILENKFYIKYVREYIRMANEFAVIGDKIFLALIAFGFILFIISYFVWLAFEILGKKLNIKSFFVGNLLVALSIGLIFWSFVFYLILATAAGSPKHFIMNITINILFLILVSKIPKMTSRIGRKNN